MLRTHRRFLVVFSLVVLPAASCGSDAAPLQPFSLTTWILQSSRYVQDKGEAISTTRFAPQAWHPVTVPSTVLAALVADKTYSDPLYAKNLRSIPGTTYPPKKLFSRLPMPEDSPFKSSWWYRTEFQTPREYKGKTVVLHFAGINYRANIWLNGRQIANTKEVAGAYRTYQFDISQRLETDKPNILAVEVFAPTEKDLAINWVDWAPTPPDKNM